MQSGLQILADTAEAIEAAKVGEATAGGTVAAHAASLTGSQMRCQAKAAATAASFLELLILTLRVGEYSPDVIYHLSSFLQQLAGESAVLPENESLLNLRYSGKTPAHDVLAEMVAQLCEPGLAREYDEALTRIEKRATAHSTQTQPVRESLSRAAVHATDRNADRLWGHPDTSVPQKDIPGAEEGPMDPIFPNFPDPAFEALLEKEPVAIAEVARGGYYADRDVPDSFARDLSREGFERALDLVQEGRKLRRK